MSPFHIVGIGEVLWDIFPEGPRFGGAPANFACTAAALAGESAFVSLVSAVGDDELGRRAIAELKARGVDSRCVQVIPGKPTGEVRVTLDGSGHPSYDIPTDAAWDAIPCDNNLLMTAIAADAVCFGTLGQRSESSRQTVGDFVAATDWSGLRVLDINLRTPFWSEDVIRESLLLANVLKLSDEELPVVADLLGIEGSERELVTRLAETYSIGLVALTRGSKGSVLCRRNGEYSEHPRVPTTVVDTVGAGDAFTATMVLGLLQNLPLDTINEWAGRVAAFVCSQPGATPHLPDSLRSPGGSS